jgi:hypothetical protein
MVDLGLHVPRLHKIRTRANIRLEFTVFEFFLYPLQRLQILPICEDIVQSVKLLISVAKFMVDCLKLPDQNLSISLNGRPDDSKEG